MSWDCEECRDLELIDERRCHGGPGKFTHPTKQGDLFTRCPKSWLYAEAAAEVDLYSDYLWYANHGTLPVAGGKLDQSPAFVEAVGVIESVIAEMDAKKKGKSVG